jgi:hypothetical protein
VIRTSDVITPPAVLAARLQIRGADSVHVAAAQRLHHRIADGEEFWFVSADLQQSAAARHEGMPVLDPTDRPVHEAAFTTGTGPESTLAGLCPPGGDAT